MSSFLLFEKTNLILSLKGLNAPIKLGEVLWIYSSTSPNPEETQVYMVNSTA